MISTTKEATVTAPASVKFQVTNRDTSVENRVETTTTVYVKVGAAATEPTRTLTLGGAKLVSTTAGVANSKVNVYAGSDGKASSNVVNKMLNGVETSTATYQIPAGKPVTISKGAFASSASLTIPVDGVNVTINYVDGANDTITFIMPDKDFTLNMKDGNKFVNEDGGDIDTQVYVLKSIGGVAGVFTETTSKEEKTLAAGGEITIAGAGTFKVTDAGTGNSVIAPTTITDKYDSTGYAEGADISIAGTANVNLYSANKVTVGTNAAISGGAAVAASGDAYVATGVSLTSAATNLLLAYDSDTKSGARQATSSFTMNDDKDVWVYNALPITLNDVTATYAGSKTVGTGDYVAEGTALTLSTADATNKVVVDTTTANTKFGEAVTSPVTYSAAKIYSAFTKVTFGADLDGTAKFEFEVYSGNFGGGATVDTTKTFGVQSSLTMKVTGKAAATNAVILNGTKMLNDTADGTTILAGTASVAAADTPWGIAKVGETAMAFTQGSST